MGYRDKGDRSRDGRGRRPAPANWSSAAEFGDATIDRPTPLRARRDRVVRQSDLPTQRTRSDAAGWATISPVDDQADDDTGAYRRSFDDGYDDGPLRDAIPSRPWRSPDDRDEPHDRYERDEPVRRYDRYSYDEPEPETDSGSWRAYEDPPRRAYETEVRRDDDVYLRTGGEPRRAARGTEEVPRRSRRALEESARRAVEELVERVRNDETPIVEGVVTDVQPPMIGLAYGDDLLTRPDTAEPDSPRDRTASEPRARHYRSDSDAQPWRARRTTEFESWRTETGSAQAWRSETVGWRSREMIELDATDTGSFVPRAIGSSASSTDAFAGQSDPDDLQAWRTETGTWRTRDTATTGSWRLPTATEDAEDPAADTGERQARTTPETGSWSRSRGRWIPGTEDTGEQPNFTVRRYDDTGELPKNLMDAARRRSLDHDESFGSGRRGDAIDRANRQVGRRRAADDDELADRRFVDPGRRATAPDRRSVDPDRRATAPDRRSADPNRRATDPVDDRTDGWRSRGSSPGAGDRHDDDRSLGERSRAGTRGPRRARSSLLDDVDGGYRDADVEPRRRSRYARDEDDAPRYGVARRSPAVSRGGRHSSDRGDEGDDRLPMRAVARRAPAYAGPRSITDSVITPRATASRGELVRVGRRPTEVDEDEDDGEEVAYGYAGAGVASVAWFGLPIGAFLLWAMFLGGTARADCVDATGRACPAPRDAAFATFATHLPQVGVAVVLSVIVAMLIRLATPFWRPATVGFAAAVVGGGVATVLFTVLNGG